MAKIGLMTWFTYDNYGSLLQCNALMKKVKDMGYDIELINYTPKQAYQREKTIVQAAGYYGKAIVKRLTRKGSGIPMAVKQKTAEYRTNLKKSIPVNTKSELFVLNREYDAFICGSDQIWAPTCYDENYFLSFVADDNKKIAYAPSIGLPVIENKYVERKMKYWIEHIGHLSTREEQGARMIQSLTGREAEVVADPTLLLDKEQWSKEFVDIAYENYIVAYFLGENPAYYKECQKIAAQLNKKLLIIPVHTSDYEKPEVLKDDIGPREFISLINKADLVLTDSFHGTIFSVNFNRPVIVFKRFKDNALSQNSRIYNILDKLELKHLLYNGNLQESMTVCFDVDYRKVNDKLKTLRSQSIDYLKQALEQAVSGGKSVSSESGMNLETPVNCRPDKGRKMITNNCTGCGVCAAACPVQCISIEKNEHGFYSYNIDHETCINCSLCTKVCSQANILSESKKIEEQQLYSAYSVEEEILMNTTSGGICTTIAFHEMKKGNPAIGCRYDYQSNRAVSGVAKTPEEFQSMRGSKYIQSYTVDALKQLKNMSGGVVFGTPCQIASVDLYLKSLKKREEFLLVDFICHGVPSYHLWDKYISNFKDVKELLFRDKKYGWREKKVTISYGESQYLNSEEKDLFYHYFNNENVYNECCYECKHREKSVADIRVGDYWGPRFIENKKGVSMVIPFTQKGKSYMEELKEQKLIDLNKQDIADYIRYQQMKNYRISLNYDEILYDLKNPAMSLKQCDKKHNAALIRRRKLRKIIYGIMKK